MRRKGRLNSVARHDALTGLANRRFFLELFEELLKSRQPGDQFAVMLIDLDRFKPINESMAMRPATPCSAASRTGCARRSRQRHRGPPGRR